jgi:hypothetical protein
MLVAPLKLITAGQMHVLMFKKTWHIGRYPRYNVTPQWVEFEQPGYEAFLTYSRFGGT